MTIRDLLDATVAGSPDATALRYRDAGAWTSRTYGEYLARVRQVGEVAGRLDVMPGRDRVALILENGPAWVEIYAALAGAGVTVVPIDPKLRPPEVAFLLGNAEVSAIFAGGRLRPLLEAVLPDLPPHLRHVVFADGAAADAPCAGRTCVALQAAMAEAATAAAAPQAWFARCRPSPQSVASILYTSGTTGRPKGAMLTHANFCADVEGCFEMIPDIGSHDSLLVVLPLFHSFSFTGNFLVAISRGACMCFTESLRTVGPDMLALRPTVLMAVPLLVEKIYDRIRERLSASRLSRWLLAAGLGAAIGARVRRTFGGRLRYLVVGGAPCPADVLAGLRRLGLPVIEGYGLTEAAPVVTLTSPREARPGTIGRRLPNIEVRIADPDAQGIGELQVRGPIVMAGYFRNPEATAEAFDNGWLRTGDLAAMDADGCLFIRGRKKALIVNREGKNIYPEEVEQCIGRHPLVRDVVVVGYREAGETGEHVGAILAPDLDAVKAACGGSDPAWTEVEARLRQAVRDRCRDLADYKHPRKIDVRREPLERTSTQKVRRHVYQGQLDSR